MLGDKTMKKINSLIISILTVAIVLSCGLFFYIFPPANSKYLSLVNDYSFWLNDKDTMIPQPQIGQMVQSFLKTPSTKQKKVAFLGFDALRADVLLNILKDDNGANSLTSDLDNSAFAHIKNNGYLYLAYAGGEKGTPTQQNTSTASGWTALATGTWGNINGVQSNGDYKKAEVKSSMLIASENYNMRSLFTVSYRSHIDKAFNVDLEYAENNNLDMKIHYVNNDEQMQEYLLDCVEVGNPLERDFIFAIYKDSDAIGHKFGFGNNSKEYVNTVLEADNMAYQLLQSIYSRPTYESEDWLIILAVDHGALGLAHGGQTDEERTVFFASNKDFFAYIS